MSTSSSEESFRDRIATVDEKGGRLWIFPKKPSGKFHNWRRLVSVFLLGLLFIGPFLRVRGEPVLLLNVIEPRFVILGKVFSQYDFYLFVILMITLIIFIALFTVVYGRIFCGWICPQTIFMEMVFRKIEYWIEGDYKQQRLLKKQSWNSDKILKKTVKHAIFFAISFIIANTFLAYIIGSEQLLTIITDPPSQHVGGLIGIGIFSLVFYGVFAQLREQVCTTICPYGRLQGVLLDKDSIVVAYDHERGESRAKFRKNEVRRDAGKGDCIDCHQCVDVCPTGIDIRNGTQLECVNCTACIDACDTMMNGVGLPTGLIRYASENEIEHSQKFKFTLRMKAYTAVLGVLIVLSGALLMIHSDIDVAMLRTPGQLYEKMDDGTYRNLYNYVIHNKSRDSLNLDLRPISDIIDRVEIVGRLSQVPPQETREGSLFIYIPANQLPQRGSKIKLGVYDANNGTELDVVKATFLIPFK